MIDYQYGTDEDDEFDPPTDGAVAVFGVVDTSDDDEPMTYPPVTLEEIAANLVRNHGTACIRLIKQLWLQMALQGVRVRRDQPTAQQVAEQLVDEHGAIVGMDIAQALTAECVRRNRQRVWMPECDEGAIGRQDALIAQPHTVSYQIDKMNSFGRWEKYVGYTDARRARIVLTTLRRVGVTQYRLQRVERTVIDDEPVPAPSVVDKQWNEPTRPS